MTSSCTSVNCEILQLLSSSFYHKMLNAMLKFVKWIVYAFRCPYKIFIKIMNVCLFVFWGSAVFLLLFVLDCGLVTRNGESSYRPPEFLMQLGDEHNARPHYRRGETQRASNLQPHSFACLPACDITHFTLFYTL